MLINARACVTCRGATSPATLDRVAGEESSLILTIRRLPSLTCAKGHRQFTHRDFPAQLLQQLIQSEEGLPVAAEKGLVFKRYLCKACGTELKRESDHRETYTVDMVFPDVETFQVEISLPVYTCESCGQVQIHSVKDLRGRTPAALAHAFQAASMPAA